MLSRFRQSSHTPKPPWRSCRRRWASVGVGRNHPEIHANITVAGRGLSGCRSQSYRFCPIDFDLRPRRRPARRPVPLVCGVGDRACGAASWGQTVVRIGQAVGGYLYPNLGLQQGCALPGLSACSFTDPSSSSSNTMTVTLNQLAFVPSDACTTTLCSLSLTTRVPVLEVGLIS